MPRWRLPILWLLLVFALGACTRVGAGGPGSGNAWTIPGVLRVGEIGEPNSLNCLLDNKAVTSDLCQLIYSYAVRYDGHGRPHPDAITALPTIENGLVSRDGLTITYPLRPGMKWQDGAPLTSTDLWFTWRAVMNPANDVINTTGWRDIARIDHADPLRAVAHLTRRYSSYLPTFWSVSGNAPILPYHLLRRLNDARGSLNTAAYNAKPVGSGPFKVVQWQRGSLVRLVANDDFYLGKPGLREIRYSTLYDQGTMLAEIQSHELDLITYGEPSTWERYRSIPGVRAIAVPMTAWRHLDFNLRDPLFADPRLRGALDAAIDRRGIVTKMLHGLGDLAEADQSPVVSWAYTPDVMHHPYDPAAARATLDALGWHVGPDGIRVRQGHRLSFVFSTTTEETLRRSMQTVIQSEWRAVGVDAVIKDYPASLYFANGPEGILRNGHYQVALYDWLGSPDPDHRNFYDSDALAPRGNNIMLWEDPAVDRAFTQIESTYDEAKQKPAYAVVQQQIAAQLPTIILYFERLVFAYNTDLKNFDPGPAQTYWNGWKLTL